MHVSACVLSVCSRGTIGIIISAWEAQLCVFGRGGGVEVGKGELGRRGGVQQRPNCSLCVCRAEGWQVSAIIDYLHTARLACSRALNSHNARTSIVARSRSPLPPLALCLRRTQNVCCAGMFTVCQCITVTHRKRKRWESPLQAHHSDRNLATIFPSKPRRVGTEIERKGEPVRDACFLCKWRGLKEIKISYKVGNYSVCLINQATSTHKFWWVM